MDAIQKTYICDDCEEEITVSQKSEISEPCKGFYSGKCPKCGAKYLISKKFFENSLSEPHK